MNTTTGLKATLERYIDAEANRRAEEILARMLAEVGIGSPGRRRRTVGGTGAGAGNPEPRAGRVVSDATRARMRAAWARRKAAKKPVEPTA